MITILLPLMIQILLNVMTITRAADTTFDLNADDTDADGETLTISEVRLVKLKVEVDPGTAKVWTCRNIWYSNLKC